MTTITWTGLRRSEDWLKQYKRRIPAAANKITLQEANLLNEIIKRGLIEQNPGGKPIKPISRMTRLLRGLPKTPASKRATHKAGFIGPLRSSERRRKKRVKRAKLGSSKVLIVTRDLLKAVRVKKHAASSYTVGVHRGERGSKSGKDMKMIASVHEGGTRKFTVTVTEKMRRFSMFLVVMKVLNVPWKVGQKLKRQIPARPFLGPAHAIWEPAAVFRFHKKLEMLLDRF